MKEIYSKKGDLTAYGLHCGYIEKKEVNNNYVELYHEHNTFHVKGGTTGTINSFWQSFEKISDARKFYKEKLI